MSSGPPWSVGDRVEFATFDDPDADTRELDGTKATVLKVPDATAQHDDVLVESIYGQRWIDPYALIGA